MPEGDTILYAANRIRPVLEGRVPDEIRTPQPRHALDRWPARLSGRTLTAVETHGKHLFLHFEGDLVIHSHLGMTGAWRVFSGGRRWRRSRSSAWLVLAAGDDEVAEFNGPLLELLTEGRRRFDQRLAALGPDVLAEEFDSGRFLRRLRADDPTRGIGDALLDQTTVAGIGNIWKAEGCWEAGLDPWRPTGRVSDAEALAVIEAIRPRMFRSGTEGHRTIAPRVYKHAGRPCPRCGARIVAQGQGDANRTTYWCPGCQR
jgi:endonuclease-8